jgi:hypothetical protein
VTVLFRGPVQEGILNARGDIVAFTDSDCVVDKNWLQQIVFPLRDDSIGIVGGKILSKRPCNTIEKFGEKIHDHNRTINEFEPPYVIYTEIISSFAKFLLGHNRSDSFCYFVFNSGKKIGKFCGSIRFFYADL